MMKQDLLIEIGCEDLPSWAGPYLQERWFTALSASLQNERISYGKLKFFYTLRRIIVYGKEVSESQTDITKEIFGPPAERAFDRDGGFTEAAVNFARSYGIPAEKLQIKERKGKKVIAFSHNEKGRDLSQIIGPIIEETLVKVEIPRGMKWGKESHKFIRPLRWILLLYGDKEIETEVFGIRSRKTSRGHRTLAPGDIPAGSPSNYMDMMLKNFVIFDPLTRFEYIKASIKKLADSYVYRDEEYLKTLSDTVEYPALGICRLKAQHRELPDGIVEAVIKKLKAIPIVDYTKNKLDNRYIILCDGGVNETIVKHYQAFIENKLEDAAFFLMQDTKSRIEDYTEEIKKIIYHPRWGSVYDRTRRFQSVAEEIFATEDIPAEKKENITEIIRLCKNDLATLMVAEFPDLQGAIGEIYAGKNGYNRIISSGIRQHYLPVVKGGSIPDTYEACVVSIIDRLETLCSFMAEDTPIKGTGDPYGLKKLATGIVEIIWKKEINLPLQGMINASLNSLGANSEEAAQKVSLAIMQRAENLLTGEKITPGIKRAILAVEQINLLNIRYKTDGLKSFMDTGGGSNLLVPFIRVANILKQAEKKEFPVSPFDESLFNDPTEKELYSVYLRDKSRLLEFYNEKDFVAFLKLLSGWKNIIDRFFDEVLVMSEDIPLRTARLGLLKKISDIFTLFADFSLIPLQEIENNDPSC